MSSNRLKDFKKGADLQRSTQDRADVSVTLRKSEREKTLDKFRVTPGDIESDIDNLFGKDNDPEWTEHVIGLTNKTLDAFDADFPDAEMDTEMTLSRERHDKIVSALHRIYACAERGRDIACIEIVKRKKIQKIIKCLYLQFSFNSHNARLGALWVLGCIMYEYDDAIVDMYQCGLIFALLHAMKTDEEKVKHNACVCIYNCIVADSRMSMQSGKTFMQYGIVQTLYDQYNSMAGARYLTVVTHILARLCMPQYETSQRDMAIITLLMINLTYSSSPSVRERAFAALIEVMKSKNMEMIKCIVVDACAFKNAVKSIGFVKVGETAEDAFLRRKAVAFIREFDTNGLTHHLSESMLEHEPVETMSIALGTTDPMTVHDIVMTLRCMTVESPAVIERVVKTGTMVRLMDHKCLQNSMVKSATSHLASTALIYGTSEQRIRLLSQNALTLCVLGLTCHNITAMRDAFICLHRMHEWGNGWTHASQSHMLQDTTGALHDLVGVPRDAGFTENPVVVLVEKMASDPLLDVKKHAANLCDHDNEEIASFADQLYKTYFGTDESDFVVIPAADEEKPSLSGGFSYPDETMDDST